MGTVAIKRRDEDVDQIRTIYWFEYLAAALGTDSARYVWQQLAPDQQGTNLHGEAIRNFRYVHYRKGLHLPQKKTLLQAETIAPGATEQIEHVLWSVLREDKASASQQLQIWLLCLAPEMRKLMLTPNGQLRLEYGDRYLQAFERRANLDGLAGLTILLRVSHDRADHHRVWLYAHGILRVLLVMGEHLIERKIGQRLFVLFQDRIFPLARYEGLRFILEGDVHLGVPPYDYLGLSKQLHSLARILFARGENDVKRAPITQCYAWLLSGIYRPWFKTLSDPVIGPDLQMSPPTQESLRVLSAQLDAQASALQLALSTLSGKAGKVE